MSRKSIDGLVAREVPRRRQQVGQVKSVRREIGPVPIRRTRRASKVNSQSSINIGKRGASSNRTPARQIGVADARRLDQLETIAQQKKLIRPILKEKERPVASIEDFLDEPTALGLINDKPTRKDLAKDKKSEKPAKKAKKPRSKKRVVIRFLIVFLVLVGIAAGVLYYIGNDLFSKVTGGGNLWNFITASADTPLETDPETGRTNILVFGTEGFNMDNPNYDGGWLTDSMMMVSIDQKNGDVKLVSLPRDLKTKTCTATGKLNEIYQCVYQKNDGSAESRNKHEKEGARALKTKFEEVLGQKIQYFVHVNWAALVQTIDALGGIDLKIVYQGEKWDGKEVALETTDKRGLAEYNSGCRCYTINFKHGQTVHLNGETALSVARMRNHDGGWGAGGGNFSREQFQQKIIQAAILKAQKTNYLTDFGAALKIKDAVGDNIRMNFKDTELKTLAKLMTKLNLGAMKSLSLQETGDEGSTSLFTTGMLPVPGVNGLSCGGSVPGCLSYVYPRAGVYEYDDIREFVTKKLISTPASNEGAKISVLNATETPGLAAEKAKKLEKKGLNVVETANAPEKFAGKTGVRIYQKNSKMTHTAEALQKIFKEAKLSEKIPKSLKDKKVDFIIVLGE